LRFSEKVFERIRVDGPDQCFILFMPQCAQIQLPVKKTNDLFHAKPQSLVYKMQFPAGRQALRLCVEFIMVPE